MKVRRKTKLLWIFSNWTLTLPSPWREREKQKPKKSRGVVLKEEVKQVAVEKDLGKGERD